MQTLSKLFTAAAASGDVYIGPDSVVDIGLVVPTGTFTGIMQVEFRQNQFGGPTISDTFTSIAAASPVTQRYLTRRGGFFRLNCTSFTGNNVLGTVTDPIGTDVDSPLKWVDVAVTAAILDGAGQVIVMPPMTGRQWKVRNVRLVGGGTNFGAGGDRLISLTDGTTVYTTIANADIEAVPAATLDWGNAKVPFLTGVSDTKTVAGQSVRFQYSGGTTDHGGVGSINFSVCLEKIA